MLVIISKCQCVSTDKWDIIHYNFKINTEYVEVELLSVKWRTLTLALMRYQMLHHSPMRRVIVLRYSVLRQFSDIDSALGNLLLNIIGLLGQVQNKGCKGG